MECVGLAWRMCSRIGIDRRLKGRHERCKLDPEHCIVAVIGYHKMRLVVDGKSTWIPQVKGVPKSSGICFRRRIPYYLTIPIETQYTVVALNNMLTSNQST